MAAEFAPVALALTMTGGFYLYLLRERRAIREARERRAHPAE